MNKLEWISVEDRLPEDMPENQGRKVIKTLVQLKSVYPKGMPTVQKRQRQQIRDYDGNYAGEWEWSRLGANRITHWMPLPAPPTKEAPHE